MGDQYGALERSLWVHSQVCFITMYEFLVHSFTVGGCTPLLKENLTTRFPFEEQRPQTFTQVVLGTTC